jgi:hypothetical protein
VGVVGVGASYQHHARAIRPFVSLTDPRWPYLPTQATLHRNDPWAVGIRGSRLPIAYRPPILEEPKPWKIRLYAI